MNDIEICHFAVKKLNWEMFSKLLDSIAYLRGLFTKDASKLAFSRGSWALFNVAEMFLENTNIDE